MYLHQEISSRSHKGRTIFMSKRRGSVDKVVAAFRYLTHTDTVSMACCHRVRAGDRWILIEEIPAMVFAEQQMSRLAFVGPVLFQMGYAVGEDVLAKVIDDPAAWSLADIGGWDNDCLLEGISILLVAVSGDAASLDGDADILVSLNAT